MVGPAPPPVVLERTTRLGSYEITASIVWGGMGEVYCQVSTGGADARWRRDGRELFLHSRI